MKRAAIVTLEGFNEIDSLLAFSMLNRLSGEHSEVHQIRADIVSDLPSIQSMNGLSIERHADLTQLATYDAVLFGSGQRTADHLKNAQLMMALSQAQHCQFIASQCSGILFLKQLALLPKTFTGATDAKTASLLADLGIVTNKQAFAAQGHIATAGGCLAGEYLASWLALKLVGREAMLSMLHATIPCGQTQRIAQIESIIA